MSSKVGSVPGGLSGRFCADNRHFSVGGLPKELGDLINLKSFDVSYNSIGGQLSIRSERFTSRLKMIVFVQALCQKCSRLYSRCSTSAAVISTRTSSLAESRLNGAHSRISRSSGWRIVDSAVSCSASALSSTPDYAVIVLFSCTGPIPKELGKLVNLEQLYLNANKLTGERSVPVLSGFVFC